MASVSWWINNWHWKLRESRSLRLRIESVDSCFGIFRDIYFQYLLFASNWERQKLRKKNQASFSRPLKNITKRSIEQTSNEKSTMISRTVEGRMGENGFMNFHIQFIVPSLAIKLLTALVKMENYDSNPPRDFMHFHVNSNQVWMAIVPTNWSLNWTIGRNASKGKQQAANC